MNHYQTLSVSQTSTPAQIKKAFRKLAFSCHPDIDKSPGAAERFKIINEAYQVLIDADQRRAYDEQLRYEQQDQKRQSAAKNPPPKPPAQSYAHPAANDTPEMALRSALSIAFTSFITVAFWAGIGSVAFNEFKKDFFTSSVAEKTSVSYKSSRPYKHTYPPVKPEKSCSTKTDEKFYQMFPKMSGKKIGSLDDFYKKQWDEIYKYCGS